MFKKGMFGIVRNILKSNADKVDASKITEGYAIRLWKWVVDTAVAFGGEDLKGLGADIGKIMAYRVQEDEEFRKKVKEVIEEAKNIEIP